MIDPAEGTLFELVRAVAPEGVEYAVDTTALVPVIEQAVLSLGQRGASGLLGVPADPATALPLSLIQTQATGTRVVGIVEGDSDPDTFIPQLLELHAAGQFPFEKLITKKPFSAINEAVAAQHEGEAIKDRARARLTSWRDDTAGNAAEWMPRSSESTCAGPDRNVFGARTRENVRDSPGPP